MTGPRLRIVAVNDVYSLDNYPRLATLIQTLAARSPADRTLVTLAGDFLAPSLLSSLDRGRGMVDVMNAIGVTHVTFGNHEDDVELADLRARMHELDAIWLATNLPAFVPRLPAYDIVEVVGSRTVRVGLIGVVDTDPALYRRSPFGGSPMLPAIDSALAMTTTLLRDHGVATVVPLTHLRTGEDRKLIAAAAPPFPVVLGGHDHQPILEQLGATWLGKAGVDAFVALVAELTWPEDAPAGADVPSVDIRFEPVAGYDEDPVVRRLVDRHLVAVRELEAAALMRIAPGATLTSIGTRAGPTSLATVLCSSIRDGLDADACIFNGGGIRGARVYESRFTYADLERELPFDNEVTVATVPGRVLREAIAYSRRLAPVDSGGYLHTDDRLEPIDDARDYAVALVRDMLLGLDDNVPLVAWARTQPDAIPPEGVGREVKMVIVEAFGARLVAQHGMHAIDTDRDGVLSVAEIARALAQGI